MEALGDSCHFGCLFRPSDGQERNTRYAANEAGTEGADG